MIWKLIISALKWIWGVSGAAEEFFFSALVQRWKHFARMTTSFLISLLESTGDQRCLEPSHPSLQDQGIWTQPGWIQDVDAICLPLSFWILYGALCHLWDDWGDFYQYALDDDSERHCLSMHNVTQVTLIWTWKRLREKIRALAGTHLFDCVVSSEICEFNNINYNKRCANPL